MNKRRLHHIWTNLRPIRPWYFFAAAGLCLLVGVFALRANNLKMVELRAAVYQADRDNGDVSAALTNLQRHVTAHMNTNLSSGDSSVYPPIQLRYTYERLREANLKTSNEQVYSDAQAHCEGQNATDFSGRNRVPCIEAYVESHGASAQSAPIPDSMYKFDFISPSWSPDLAGFSLLASTLPGLIGVTTWFVNRWFKSHVA